MTLMTFVYLIAGLVLLVAGAEVLVRGAARLAAQFGISPLVIGLTVVAFGTSAPETAVSVQASLNGSGDIAIGNVVGSNIANVLLILGMTALVAPLVVSRQLIRLDVPIMIGASLVTFGLAWDGQLSRIDGAILFSAVVIYTLFLVISSRRESAAAADDEFAKEFGLDEPAKPHAGLINAGLVLAGLVLLVVGSNFLVEGAVALARALGLSELVIGLTVIAVGTSLPELATSIMAAFRGERDIAVGNIVGSNIFNLLCVLGLASLVSPQAIGVVQRTGVRLPGNDRGRRGLPADLLRRLLHQALGRRAVPRLLRGVHAVPGTDQHRSTVRRDLRRCDDRLCPAADRHHPAGHRRPRLEGPALTQRRLGRRRPARSAFAHLRPRQFEHLRRFLFLPIRLRVPSTTAPFSMLSWR